MIKVALPNKGVLADEATRLAEEAGYNCQRRGREQFVRDTDNEIEFCFIRPRDIPVYVSNGIFAYGITGRDLARDSGCAYEEILPLDFGHSSFCYAVPCNAKVKAPEELNGFRVATSYVQIVERDLSARGVSAQTVRLDGAVEISVRLGVADAIADVVESGRTMAKAGLRILEGAIMHSEAILLTPPHRDSGDEPKGCETLPRRIESVLLARRYMMIEYDIATISLKEACSVTPGIESPTVAPLHEEGWVAVKAMIKRAEAHTVMDRLSAIGAKGILISDVKACRL